MYLSIFSNIITGATPADVARRTRELGLRSVQLIPDEVNVGWGFDGRGATGSFAEWADAYHREGIDICGVGGYINVLAPNPERRRRNIEVFKSFLRGMNTLGCRYISTETGSLSPKGDWDYDPRNSTPEAWSELRAVTDELLEVASQENVVILYEPYVANVCSTPELGARFVREVNSPHLQMLMDPTNWFDVELAHPTKVPAVLERGFAAERGLFRLAHAKDVTPAAPGEDKPGLPGAGQGILDYARYVQLLRAHDYNGPLVIEHISEAEIPRTMQYVQRFIDAYAG